MPEFTNDEPAFRLERAGIADGRLKGNEALAAEMVLTIGKVGLSYKVDGTIELE